MITLLGHLLGRALRIAYRNALEAALAEGRARAVVIDAEDHLARCARELGVS